MSRAHWRLDRRRWAVTRRVVFDRDGWRCVRCGRAGRLECDHKEPLWRSPSQDPYDPDGCQTLCRGCHIEKTVTEAAARAGPLSPAAAAWQALVDELAG